MIDRQKVYVLTGCASGIGRATAHRIATAGARLVATDVDLEALQRTAAEGAWPEATTELLHHDVRDPEAWEQLLDGVEARQGRLDVVMNIAGVLKPGFVHQTTAAEVDFHFDINVKGVLHGTRAAAVRMVRRGSGHIINMASLASLAPIPGLALYSASKFAVRAYSMAAAQELACQGVAVTAMCPDAVATPMLELQKEHEAAALTFTAPRFLSPEEIADHLTGAVLTRRPRLLVIPRWRGWLARAADMMPWLTKILTPRLTRQGLSRLHAMRRMTQSAGKF
jgi:3-oxoacyl-[acyl-carrier protein] reductase